MPVMLVIGFKLTLSLRRLYD